MAGSIRTERASLRTLRVFGSLAIEWPIARLGVKSSGGENMSRFLLRLKGVTSLKWWSNDTKVQPRPFYSDTSIIDILADGIMAIGG